MVDSASTLRWSFIGLASKIAVQTVAGIILARIVGPEGYGIIALATVYVMLTSLLLTQGMGLAIVRMETPTSRDFATVNLASMAAALLLGAGTIALSLLIEEMLSAPGLSPILNVLACGLVLKALSIIPLARLMRKLRFDVIARAETISSGVGAVAGVAAATAGAGVWGFVVLTLVSEAIYLAMTWSQEREMPWRGSWKSLSNLFSFTLTVTATQLLGFAARNVDNLLIARFLNPSALGYYSVSYRFMRIPITSLVMVINRALYPLFSRYQNDKERLARNFLLATSAMSLLTWPMMALVIVFANEIILMLYGPEWLPAVIPTQILAVAALVQALSAMMTPAMLVAHRERAQLYFTVAITGTLAISFFFAAQRGINAVALAYTTITIAYFPVAVRLMGDAVHFRMSQYVKAVAPSASMAISVSVVAFVARAWMVGEEWPPLVVVFLGSAAAGVVTFAWSWLLLRGYLKEEVLLLRRLLRRPAVSPVDPID